MKYSARSKRLSGINVYMTNTPTDIVPMGQVHDWYSLRWQIEILLKRGIILSYSSLVKR